MSWVTIDAILDPAAHGLHLLSDIVLAHLPLNGVRYKQLSYKPNGLVAKRNLDLAEFFRVLGPCTRSVSCTHPCDSHQGECWGTL